MAFSPATSVDYNNVDKTNINPEAPSFVPASDPPVSGSDTKAEPASSAVKGKQQEQRKLNHDGRPCVKYLTCWFWANGGCKKSGEQCLYSHYNTGKYAQRPHSFGDGERAVAGHNLEKKARENGSNYPLSNSPAGSPMFRGVDNARSNSSPMSQSVYQSPYVTTPMNPTTQRSTSNGVYASPSLLRLGDLNRSTPTPFSHRLSVGAERFSPQGLHNIQFYASPSYHPIQAYTPMPAPALRAGSHDRMELMYSNMNIMMAARKLDECVCTMMSGLAKMDASVQKMRTKNGVVTNIELVEVQKVIQQVHALALQARATAMGYVKGENNSNSIFEHQSFIPQAYSNPG